MQFDHEDIKMLMQWRIILDVICYRGRIGFENSISFVIHSNEQGHNKPHLHAKYNSSEVVIEIPTGEIITGNLPKDKNKLASKWVIDNSDYLKSKWNELSNGIKIPNEFM